MKHTLQTQANYEKRMDIYAKKPYYMKKYVCNRTNSLAEVRRIYIYLIGNTKGLSKFEQKIKELQPDAKKNRGGNVEWHFDEEFLWDVIKDDERMVKALVRRRIDTFEELSFRIPVY